MAEPADTDNPSDGSTDEEFLPNASNSVTVRLSIPNRPGMLADVTSAIGARGGNIGAIDIVRAEQDMLIRDITINARSAEHAREVVRGVDELD
jgi:malate dehydrogenase (oxaloacetate-decarboxylating)